MSYADAILEAFESRRLIPLLTDADPRFDKRAAYDVAAEIHARRIDRGERPVGRKIGFTNRDIWPRYNVAEPIWAHVYDATLIDSTERGAVAPVGHLVQPRVEPEVQLHFARRPPVTTDAETILECVDWIALGFEIVHCPFEDWRFRAPD